MSTRRTTPREQVWLRRTLEQRRRLYRVVFLLVLILASIMAAMTAWVLIEESPLDGDEVLLAGLMGLVLAVLLALLAGLWKGSRKPGAPTGPVFRVQGTYTVREIRTREGREYVPYIGDHLVSFPAGWQETLSRGQVVDAELYAMERPWTERSFVPAASASFVLTMGERSIDAELDSGHLGLRSSTALLVVLPLAVLLSVWSAVAWDEGGLHPTVGLLWALQHGASVEVFESVRAADRPPDHKQVMLRDVAVICDGDTAAAVDLPEDAQTHLEAFERRMKPRREALAILSEAGRATLSLEPTWARLEALSDNPAFEDTRRRLLIQDLPSDVTKWREYVREAPPLDPELEALLANELEIAREQAHQTVDGLFGGAAGVLLLETDCPYPPMDLNERRGQRGFGPGTLRDGSSAYLSEATTPRTARGLVVPAPPGCPATRCSFALDMQRSYDWWEIGVFHGLLLLFFGAAGRGGAVFWANRSVRLDQLRGRRGSPATSSGRPRLG